MAELVPSSDCTLCADHGRAHKACGRASDLTSVALSADEPVVFTWTDVAVTLQSSGKVLLPPNSGTLCAGELACILGPSGAGKTTLLSALSGQGDAALTSGSVRLDGAPPARGALGYVRQRDIFVASLTVHETLIFTAQLRMSADATRAEVHARVAQLAKDLGLEHTLKTAIGSTMQRGVSGGELKRVNIAAELLSMPRVLLLDEPTSGLDSTYALTVGTRLRAYARAHGVAMLAAIHQPSSQLVRLVDTLVLMAPSGRTVFRGVPASLGARLHAMGRDVPPEVSLADHVMQLLCTESTEADEKALWQVDGADDAPPSPEDVGGEKRTARRARTADGLVSVVPPAGRRRRLPFWRTVVLLARRQRKQSGGVLLKRDELAFAILAGLIIGLVWWQAAGTEAQAGALFFFVAHMTWWPGYLYLFSFPGEVAVLTKELLSDCYSIEAYVCAKLVADTPAEVVVPSLFFAVAMPMVGFAPGASATIWLIMLLQYQTSSTIGMLIAIAASHPRFPLSPNTFISCWNIYQMTAGGFLRDANTLPPGLRWIGYLSIQYYSHGVLSAAASADGVAEPRYSSLGIGGNITVVALIVVVLKMLLYVALRTRRLRFE
eukprot:Transcript_25360.p1 GENE.Transcript_25360~~Transcript_25360.p1  ORF type:complete len:606 (+),score=229.90 Transcript_25360:111-1928(+)